MFAIFCICLELPLNLTTTAITAKNPMANEMNDEKIWFEGKLVIPKKAINIARKTKKQNATTLVFGDEEYINKIDHIKLNTVRTINNINKYKLFRKKKKKI